MANELKLNHLTEQGNAHMSMCLKRPRPNALPLLKGSSPCSWNARHRAFSPREKRRRYCHCTHRWHHAAKKTSELIPLCHPVMLTNVTIDLLPIWGDDAPATEKQASHASGPHPCGIHVVAQASLVGKTGVEMEALTAASVACLTIYDMCKAIDRGMEIGEVRLVHKEGGKSGVWHRS